MMTPQEIHERSEDLSRAIFGGYTVSSVDSLLETIQEEYDALYKENLTLQGKLKILVEKLEDYRAQEETIKRTLLKAQNAADDLMASAERKSAKMISDTEEKMRQRSLELGEEVAAEERRVDRMKTAVAQYMTDLQAKLQGQMTELEHIKQMEPDYSGLDEATIAPEDAEDQEPFLPLDDLLSGEIAPETAPEAPDSWMAPEEPEVPEAPGAPEDLDATRVIEPLQ